MEVIQMAFRPIEQVQEGEPDKNDEVVMAAMVNNIEWYIQLFWNEVTEPNDGTESSVSEESKDIIIIDQKISIKQNKGNF